MTNQTETTTQQQQQQQQETVNTSEQQSANLSAHALSGALGGIASMLLTYPLITISTRNQVQKQTLPNTTTSNGKRQSLSPVKRSSLSPTSDSNLSIYKGQIDTFKRILKEEGIKGFYSGLNSALFGIAVTQGVYYYWYELVKGFYIPFNVNNANASMTTTQSISAGAVAGIATSMCTNPIWVVNTRMTVKSSSSSSEKKKGLRNTILKIIKDEGFQGFFRGLTPALILVSNPIIQYSVFEKLKEYLQKSRKQLSGFDFFILGAVSKMIATLFTFPILVVKSRMQLRQNESERYKSPLDGLQQILQKEGLRGLYKGLESKIVQSVLTSAFLFAFKEELYKASLGLLSATKKR